jgi:hypothetical protein
LAQERPNMAQDRPKRAPTSQNNIIYIQDFVRLAPLRLIKSWTILTNISR